MAIEKPMRIPVNGTWEEFNPQTSLNMIKDMSSFIKQLSVASDAESARKVLDAAATNHGIHVPAGGTNTQFLRGDLTWQSIQTVIGQGFVAQSLQQNGWVKAANGLIIQWGTYQGSDGEVFSTLPIPFLNTGLAAACTTLCAAIWFTNTKIFFRDTGNGGSSKPGGMYIAIGY